MIFILLFVAMVVRDNSGRPFIIFSQVFIEVYTMVILMSKI